MSVLRSIISATIFLLLIGIWQLWNYAGPLLQMGKNLVLMHADLPADDWVGHLNAPERFTRTAAIAGLAKHQDRRAVEPLTRELQALAAEPAPAEQLAKAGPFPRRMASIFLDIHVPQLLLGAAQALPDPSYIPALEQILLKQPHNEELRDALAANRQAAGQTPNIAASTAATRLDDPALLRDLLPLRDAVTAASPYALLQGLAGALALDDSAAKTIFVRECFRRPEADMADVAARAALGENPGLRTAAAIALGRTGNETRPPDKVLATLKILSGDPAREVAVEALSAIHMRTHGNADILKALAAAQHPHEDVRAMYLHFAYSTFVADWLEGEEDIDSVVPFLRDPSPKVRSAACAVFISILGHQELRHMADRPDVRAAALAIANDDQATINYRGEAMSVLTNLGDKAVVPIIEQVLAVGVNQLTAGNLGELSTVIQAAGEMPHPSYVPALQRYKKKLAEFAEDDGELADLIAKSRKARR
jgi:hypothetical protein